MSTTTMPTHPVLGCVASVRAAVDAVAGSQPVYMDTEDKATALEGLARAEAQLAELRLRVMATGDDVAHAHAAPDVAVWLANQTNAEPRAMRADLDLAHRLDGRYGRVAAGMATGDVNAAQARVICDALDDLAGSDAVGPDLLHQAEQTLVGHAAVHRPGELRHLGRRLLHVLAPETAEAEEARKLADEEREARKKAKLQFRPLGDGTTRISGLLPDPVAARLKTYLDAFTSPRRQHANGRDRHGGQDPGPFGIQDGDRIPQARKYAEAFAALLEHLDPANLPEHGGDATTVMVTITLDQLRHELAAAGLIDADSGDGGSTITAAEARRLACTARIIPVVLGGESEILDQGRAQRLFTPAQRRAMRLRDQVCRTEGCTTPATWCEAHHLTPWSAGGRTDLDSGVMLCPFHHHRIHDPTHTTDRLPNGDLRFHRRP